MRSLEIASQRYADETQKKADAANNIFLISKKSFKDGAGFAFEEILDRLEAEQKMYAGHPISEFWLENLKFVVNDLKKKMED